MSKPKFTIRSDGQFGADIGALDAAMEFNETNKSFILEITGWCPKGRRAEGAKIDKKYPLKETTTNNYNQAIEQNIKDSDGTLILLLEGNDADKETTHAIEKAKEFNKPSRTIILSNDSQENINQTLNWLKDTNIEHLNVKGPRESNTSGIGEKTHSFILDLLKELSTNPDFFKK
ncbi:molybdenum cofactor carrier [Gigaspora rosea]|uniref:Molybdenum cofactor carrier n=1 Tax=Gigaspora rosea TaxID=44941 RepID=A0A397VKZ2_9GLOM|nr:molybdenum cofactor carrier [Gigaspora rosea]CAG8462910.1 9667_t:CDS:1 [Gigaspora rosea]